jgi:hypothetical protein
MLEAQEINYLLRFFSQPQEVQWQQVPDRIAPVWVDTGGVEAATEHPIRLLSLILYARLNRGPRDFDDGAFAILDEIRVLIGDWMLESPYDVIFTKRQEPDQLDLIWRILSRLCSIALSYQSVAKFSAEGISLRYMLEKYTHPIDSNTFNFPIL